MKRLVFKLRQLRQDKAGVVAMITALAMPVLIGATALTIDISYFRHVQGVLQSAADSGALAGIAKLDTPSTAVTDAVNYSARNVPATYGSITTAGDVEIGIWDPDTKQFTVATGNDVNSVRVTARRDPGRGNGLQTILIQYFDKDAPNILATATAARHLVVQYEPPEKTDLDAEAGDFNEMYVYCYNYKSVSGDAASRRSQMTLISNNMPVGKDIKAISGNVIDKVAADPLVWPECAKDESLSFRVRNIRHAKNMPDLWADPNKSPKRPEHNYYTDTVIASGLESFAGLGTSILETVRCDTIDKCDPSKAGHIIPSGKNRTPVVSSEPCMPGKYMYFGWEDRPPGQAGASGNWTQPAWTDKDYNDIRIIMRCPRTGRLGDGIARLVG